MEIYRLVFWVMIIISFGFAFSFFYLINKINTGEISKNKEKLAGKILFFITIIAGIAGLLTTFSFEIEQESSGILLSILLFAFSGFSLIMAFGKTKDVKRDLNE